MKAVSVIGEEAVSPLWKLFKGTGLMNVADGGGNHQAAANFLWPFKLLSLTFLLVCCSAVCLRHPPVSNRNISVSFIRRSLLEVLTRRPKRHKCVRLHPICCQMSARSLMQMYKLLRLWMCLKCDLISYPLPLSLEFSPNEFLIKESLFFHISYFVVLAIHISSRSRPPSYMCHVLILIEVWPLGFAYIFPNLRCKFLASQLRKVQTF